MELRRHGIRTVLTATGVTVAVTAFTMVAGIAEVARREIRAELEGVGGRPGTVRVSLHPEVELGPLQAARAADLLRAGLSRYGARPAARVVPATSFTLRQDAAPLPTEGDDPDEAGCGAEVPVEAEDAELLVQPCVISLYGADTELLQVMGAELVAGRWLEPGDGTRAAVPVALPRDLAERVRDVDHPTVESLVGSVLHDEDRRQPPLVVVGIVGENAVASQLASPEVAFVPLQAVDRLFGGEEAVESEVTAVGVVPSGAAETVAEAAAEDGERALGLAGLSASPVSGERLDLAGALDQALRVLNLVLLVIGLVTMGLGAIGVLNVSLMTVRQRVREFGLRRAVGARPAQLGLLVLFESVLVTVLGGAVGVALAMGIAVVLMGLGVEPVRELGLAGLLRPAALGLAVAAATGVAAGFLPALRAGRLTILEALRR